MKYLFITIGVFFSLLSIPLALEKLFNQTVTGRGLAGSMAFGLAFTGWRWLQARRSLRAADQGARLRRRALLHMNGNERGEVSGLLVLVGCLLFVALIAATVQLCAAEPIHIDKLLAEASGQLFPAVPLSGQELEDLQAVALSVGVISRGLQNVPGDMPAVVREKRFAMRRELERLHTGFVELMVQHAGAVVQATRKGGAR